jgi:hypothetical protein
MKGAIKSEASPPGASRSPASVAERPKPTSPPFGSWPSWGTRTKVLIIAEPISRVAMLVVSTGRRMNVAMLTSGSRVRRWRKANRASPLKPTSMRAAVLGEVQPQSAPREMAMRRPVREMPRTAAPRMSTRPGVRIGEVGTNRRVVVVASRPMIAATAKIEW